jgi:HAD superfamily hydrolase (TIGR01484 family)
MQRSLVSTFCETELSGQRALSVLDSERTFYEQHSWCLNAFPTFGEILEHLRDELDELRREKEDWRQAELLTNVFLLSCAVSDTVDDYLSGPKWDFSRAVGVFGPSRVLAGPMDRAMQLGSHLRAKLLHGLSSWRDAWEAALARFMVVFAEGSGAIEALIRVGNDSLPPLLQYRFPTKLLLSRSRIPAAFRSQDLTHFDAFELGRKFMQAYPVRTRPLVLIGLRTAGSYFAPLVRGYLTSQGYGDVTSLTLRPKHGIGLREGTALAQAVRRGALAILIDEPVYSASTAAKGIDCLRNAGFGSDDIVALFPIHPTPTDWKTGAGGLPLQKVRVLTLEPEEWRKSSLLKDEAAASRIQEYFEARDGIRAVVSDSVAARELTASLEDCFEPGFHWRLKRVYEVKLYDARRPVEKRFILAKSVGWGWLGYHAFLAGTRLVEFVPQVLGLRDGILYMEWAAPARTDAHLPKDGRGRVVDSAASYVASRVRALGLQSDPTRDLIQAGRHKGTEELAGILSGAYGWKVASVLKRSRIQHQLAKLSCTVPTLIDGKMRQSEWIDVSNRLVKTDFEHHGMGKHELNVTDPTYDLAEVILHARLSVDEERDLLHRYTGHSGDRDIAGRLFLYKLLAGSWAMARAADNIKNSSLADRHQEFNQRFIEASQFLTIQTTRFCAALCNRPSRPSWSEPLVVLDVDGVLDKQIFGFPSTSAAGIAAVSLLASHGIAVALNTARSVSEMKEYCKAYGFIGGVAEYGGFAWDAVSGREEVLVSADSLNQMRRLEEALRTIPGVFLNEDYRLIVRAHMYARGTTIPLPEGLIKGLMAKLKLEGLRLHQTYTDSTVTAAEVDKGSGLKSLLSLAGHSGLETVAVGDSEPDLSMFRAASRSFAPAHIGCAQPARLLGCRIASRPYQSGLLEIVRSLVHTNGGTCANCHLPQPVLHPADKLFVGLLAIADRRPLELLGRSLFDLKAVRTFLK